VIQSMSWWGGGMNSLMSIHHAAVVALPLLCPSPGQYREQLFGPFKLSSSQSSYIRSRWCTEQLQVACGGTLPTVVWLQTPARRTAPGLVTPALITHTHSQSQMHTRVSSQALKLTQAHSQALERTHTLHWQRVQA
jgi:hypothetical protein